MDYFNSQNKIDNRSPEYTKKLIDFTKPDFKYFLIKFRWFQISNDFKSSIGLFNNKLKFLVC